MQSESSHVVSAVQSEASHEVSEGQSEASHVVSAVQSEAVLGQASRARIETHFPPPDIVA